MKARELEGILSGRLMSSEFGRSDLIVSDEEKPIYNTKEIAYTYNPGVDIFEGEFIFNADEKKVYKSKADVTGSDNTDFEFVRKYLIPVDCAVDSLNDDGETWTILIANDFKCPGFGAAYEKTLNNGGRYVTRGDLNGLFRIGMKGSLRRFIGQPNVFSDRMKSGYPRCSILMNDNGSRIVSTSDNNTSNPKSDSEGVLWKPFKEEAAITWKMFGKYNYFPVTQVFGEIPNTTSALNGTYKVLAFKSTVTGWVLLEGFRTRPSQIITLSSYPFDPYPIRDDAYGGPYLFQVLLSGKEDFSNPVIVWEISRKIFSRYQEMWDGYDVTFSFPLKAGETYYMAYRYENLSPNGNVGYIHSHSLDEDYKVGAYHLIGASPFGSTFGVGKNSRWELEE